MPLPKPSHLQDEAVIKWKRGDRIVVMYDKNEHYVATVTNLRKKPRSQMLHIVYDEGSKEWISSRSKYVKGLSNKGTKRVKPISDSELSRWVDDPGEPAKRTLLDPPDVRPDPITKKKESKKLRKLWDQYKSQYRELMKEVRTGVTLAGDRDLDPKVYALFNHLIYKGASWSPKQLDRFRKGQPVAARNEFIVARRIIGTLQNQAKDQTHKKAGDKKMRKSMTGIAVSLEGLWELLGSIVPHYES